MLPHVILEANVSLAWAAALVALDEAPRKELGPVMISFSGFEAAEIRQETELRSLLDGIDRQCGMERIDTVANTIFPWALWRYAKGNRHRLYEMYRENLPAYIGLGGSKNRRGLYFARLVGFNLDHRTGEVRISESLSNIGPDGNQLEFLIQQCKPSRRRSMLQAAVFDPNRDHTTSAQLGFPCLQHLTLVPDFPRGTLQLNALYATQQLYAKGYGNYLGLARLGLFLAGQVGLTLDRVTCFVGIQKMDKRPKRRILDHVVATCRSTLAGSVVN